MVAARLLRPRADPACFVLAGAFLALAAPRLFAQLPASAFAYPKQAAEIKQVSAKLVEPGVRVRDVTFAGENGERIPAYLIEPARGCGPRRAACAGVLFVHWYDKEASNANRSEFLPDAYDLARHGAVSLLPDAMWAKPHWLEERNAAGDQKASLHQVKDLRRALDVLVHRPGVDPGRIGLVGHDFGMMYGSILAGVDHRIRAAVLMAGNTCLSDWFLNGRKLNRDQRERLRLKFSPWCPVMYLSHITGPVFLQFGTNDPYVPPRNAQRLADAAPEPKKVRFYDGGHGLNGQARVERLEWLTLRLRLRPDREQ